jgi:hypothetical protein
MFPIQRKNPNAWLNKDLEINAFEEIKVRNLLYRKIETAELRVEKAVPWLMGLVAGLTQWRPGFALGKFHVGGRQSSIGTGFSPCSSILPVNIIPP